MIQLPLTKSVVSVGTKAGSVGTPTFAPDGANVASVPPTVPLPGQTGRRSRHGFSPGVCGASLFVEKKTPF